MLRGILQFSSVHSVSRVRLYVTPWTAARHTFVFITNSQSLLKLMSIELVMPSNLFTLCRPLLLPPSIFPGIRVFSNKSGLIGWPKDWSFSCMRHSLQYPKHGSMSVGSAHPQTTGLRICGTYAEQNITQP